MCIYCSKMFVAILLIISSIQHTFATTVYDCRNGTVYLNVNEIAFYETTNFPRYLSNDEMEACGLTFILANNTSNTTKMFTSYVQANYPITYSFLINDDRLFQIRDIHDDNGAQKGIIIFEENTDNNCPLESISRIKPLKINNEDEVIYLYSNYYKNTTRKQDCFWRFEAPDGYGFKIVIQTFAISSQTSIRIRNSTDDLINEGSVKINRPIYNSDIYLEIYLSKGDPIFITDIEFQAYVSIVKNLQEKQEINCTTQIISEDVVYWSNADDAKNGYNTDCGYDVIIPEHYVVIASVEDFNVEEGVDYISYTIDTDSQNVMFGSNVVMEPYKNGTEKHISWKFVSDGSVNLPGFKVIFQHIFCQCENRLVECDTDGNVIMNSTTKEDYVCGNLLCNITIGPCESKLTSVEIDFTKEAGGDIEHNDVFRIISNGQVILDIHRQAQYSFTAFLNSDNINIFQVITFPSPVFQRVSFGIYSVDEPIFGPKIILSDIDTTVIINNPINYFATIEKTKEMIERNISYILYCLDPSFIALYNNESLTASLDICFNEHSPYVCNIKENSFVLYHIDSAITAITLSSGSSNCVFQKNVFMTTSSMLAVSGMANENGACLLTILLADETAYFISQLWTTSKKEYVKMFVGIDQSILLFEFNKKSMPKWKDAMLQSPVYTVLIPRTETLYFTLQLYDTDSDYITIAQYPYLSLVTTPWYGCSNEVTTDSATIKYEIKNVPVKFTVLDYIAVDGNSMYFDLGNDEYVNINKTGDSIIFKNQTVVFFYNDMDNLESSALIFIEAIKI